MLRNFAYLGLSLGLSLMMLPVQAQTSSLSISNQKPYQQFQIATTRTTVPTQRVQTKAVTLPANSPILITIPQNITLDVGAKEEFFTTAILTQGLYDPSGNQLAPKNSAVTITVKPSGDGAKIYATSIIAGPLTIPLQAASQTLPGKTIELEDGMKNGAANSRLGSAFGGLFGTVLAPSGVDSDSGNDALQTRVETQQQWGSIGGLLGGLIGMAEGGESVRIVQIQAGQTFPVYLEQAIVINQPMSGSYQSTPVSY